MVDFAVIELEDGLTVMELRHGQSVEHVAAIRGGILVDLGPYPSYEDAYDALIDLQYEEEEERE